MSLEQLMELVSRIWQIVSGRSGMSGGPVRLTIREQVVATLIVLRHNVNQATIADMFGVSQPTISRVYRRVVPVIEQACCLSGVALDTAIHGRGVLVDGTDVPTGNRVRPRPRCATRPGGHNFIRRGTSPLPH
ncbi:transposase family protein [Rathayibacter toxicus]|nr:transposase family protein [Rathayibacter toxicus]QWL50733.1 transposase family protein [Rathayibacter toxicus]